MSYFPKQTLTTLAALQQARRRPNSSQVPGLALQPLDPGPRPTARRPPAFCYASHPAPRKTPHLSGPSISFQKSPSVQIMTSNSLRASGIREVPGRCKHNLENYKEEDSPGPHLRRHRTSFSPGPGSDTQNPRKALPQARLRRVLGPAGAWAWGHGSAIPPPTPQSLPSPLHSACLQGSAPTSLLQADLPATLSPPSLDPKQPDFVSRIWATVRLILFLLLLRGPNFPKMGQTLIMIRIRIRAAFQMPPK